LEFYGVESFFWIHKNYVREVKAGPTDIEYHLVESLNDIDSGFAIDSQGDEDMERIAVSSEAESRGASALLESYILGMLSNLNALTTQRIHQMLSMFQAPDFSYNKTETELSHFLMSLVSQKKLEFVDGLFKRSGT